MILSCFQIKDSLLHVIVAVHNIVKLLLLNGHQPFVLFADILSFETEETPDSCTTSHSDICMMAVQTYRDSCVVRSSLNQVLSNRNGENALKITHMLEMEQDLFC